MGEGCGQRAGGRWFESEVRKLFFWGGGRMRGVLCGGRPSESADGGGRPAMPVCRGVPGHTPTFFFLREWNRRPVALDTAPPPTRPPRGVVRIFSDNDTYSKVGNLEPNFDQFVGVLAVDGGFQS